MLPHGSWGVLRKGEKTRIGCVTNLSTQIVNMQTCDKNFVNTRNNVLQFLKKCSIRLSMTEGFEAKTEKEKGKPGSSSVRLKLKEEKP